MFKEGNYVKIKKDCSGTKAGEIYRLVEDDGLWTKNKDGRKLCDCQYNWELYKKELKDVEFGDMITDGTEFRYILGRVNDVIFTGLGNRKEKAKNDEAYTWSLPEFLRIFVEYKIVEESDDVDVTVDGKTTTISRKSAEALNLI